MRLRDESSGRSPYPLILMHEFDAARHLGQVTSRFYLRVIARNDVNAMPARRGGSFSWMSFLTILSANTKTRVAR